jgi:Dolichyl-phosphate-mannose-protein mannosyltransferase
LTSSIFLISWLAIPIFGLPAALCFGPNDSRIGRLSFAFGAGATALTLAMLLLTAAGVPWTLFRIAIAMSPLLLLAPLARSGKAARIPRIDRRAIPGLITILLAVLVLTYAAGTARATSTDLLYFWGTKGEVFAAAHRIDATFLADPDHFPLHPDYPPLLPCLYAWGAMASGRFPWGAAVLTAPVLFILTLATFWGYARRRLGDARAALSGGFLGALMGFGFIASSVAGNAEPALILFETLALAILVFGDRSRRDDLAASIALAGCALAKFEGAVFVLAAVGASVIFEREKPDRGKALPRLLVLPALALGSWLAFCARHGLLDNYKGGLHGTFTLVNLSKVAAGVAKSASYGVGFLPWIALALLWAVSGPRRESLAPAAVAAAFTLVNVSFYLHGTQDPTDWIAWSARRILLTPLLCLVFAASAHGGSSEPARAGDRP